MSAWSIEKINCPVSQPNLRSLVEVMQSKLNTITTIEGTSSAILAMTESWGGDPVGILIHNPTINLKEMTPLNLSLRWDSIKVSANTIDGVITELGKHILPLTKSLSDIQLYFSQLSLCLVNIPATKERKHIYNAVLMYRLPKG